MRKMKLEDIEKNNEPIPKEKKVRRRPTPKWKLIDSIKYIKMRNEYLREEGILVKKGEMKWKLNV